MADRKTGRFNSILPIFNINKISSQLNILAHTFPFYPLGVLPNKYKSAFLRNGYEWIPAFAGMTELGHKLFHENDSDWGKLLMNSFTHSPIHPFTHSPIHPFTHSLIHPFTHSLIHPFTHSPIHSFTHSPIHPFTYSLIHTNLNPVFGVWRILGRGFFVRRS